MMMMMTKKNSNVEKKESNNDGPRYRCVLIFLGGVCAFVCVLFLLLLLQPLFFINIIPQGIFFNLKHPALSPLEKKFFLFISSHTQFFFQCFPSSLFLRRKGSRMGVWCGNGKKTHLIIFFVNEKKVFFQFANGGVGACACAARMVLTFFSCFFFLFDQCRFGSSLSVSSLTPAPHLRMLSSLLIFGVPEE